MSCKYKTDSMLLLEQEGPAGAKGHSIFEACVLLVPRVMAVVLISWVSMSVVFCLALVRAAARRYVQEGNSETATATPGRTPSAVHHNGPKQAHPPQLSPAL